MTPKLFLELPTSLFVMYIFIFENERLILSITLLKIPQNWLVIK